MNISPQIHSMNNLLVGTITKALNNQIDASSPNIGEVIVTDSNVDLYEQATKQFQGLGYTVAETSFCEGAVTNNLDKIKAQMQASKRDSRISIDKYNALLRYRAEPVEDGRAHTKQLNSLIDNIHSGYQKKYGEIIKATTQYMQDVNTALGKMSSYIEPGKDGKIKFYPLKFAKEIDSAVSKSFGVAFSNSNPSHYFGQWSANLDNAIPLISIKGNSQEFAFWDKKLSGQGFVVKHEKENIKIYPDEKPIKEIFLTIKGTSADWDGKDIMSQELQSLQTAIDSQKNTVNSSVSRLLETFRQDNSHFETLVQLLIQLIKDLHQNNNGLINM